MSGKVTAEEASAIRDLFSTGRHSQKAIARMTGRSVSTIHLLVGSARDRAYESYDVALVAPVPAVRSNLYCHDEEPFIKPPTMAQLMAGR